MRMFKRPPADESTTTTYDHGERPTAETGVATTRQTRTWRPRRPRATPVARRWHDPTRAFATLLGVAVAGFLAWLTTRIGDGTTGGYWAEYGILAGAGLSIALTSWSAAGRSGGGRASRRPSSCSRSCRR